MLSYYYTTSRVGMWIQIDFVRNSQALLAVLLCSTTSTHTERMTQSKGLRFS
jgi:hypothetical protein